MAKRPRQEDPADAAADLLTEAQGCPDGFLDDEIHDACQAEAGRREKELRDGVLLGQIEFLLVRGYSPRRIRELIAEAASQNQE